MEMPPPGKLIMASPKGSPLRSAGRPWPGPSPHSAQARARAPGRQTRRGEERLHGIGQTGRAAAHASQWRASSQTFRGRLHAPRQPLTATQRRAARGPPAPPTPARPTPSSQRPRGSVL